ncbi:roadblock/LC7 domain-containing protein [Methanobacterium sp.]|uniref:roadblock/LC7 domain-containing protein n=1 Tax=Methanobacterium sp. TaxID=2164 RepID=UPI002ABC7C84|nr:roadblock/LC7 domain-containing protein [Methanobacterium sp.]MDY9922620.1 hypothetical protein [Methanobacterium sp.]
MTDTHLKMQLEKATVDLDKTPDVEGILIVASDGRILHHNLRVDVDINLFGPMSQVISSSSLRLLNSSGQGEMERVLVESSGGKALFLGLEKVHLIILMQGSANVGMVLVNAKRASQKIHEVTHDLELEVPKETIVEEISIPEEVPVEEVPVEEVPVEEVPVEEVPVEEIPTTPVTTEEPLPETTATKEPPIETVVADEKTAEDLPLETLSESADEPVLEPVLEKAKKITAEPLAEVNEPAVPEEPPAGIETELETDVKAELETEVKSEVETGELTGSDKIEELKVEELEMETEMEVAETEPEEVKPSIPTVRPPISFPSLPTDVEIPEDPEKRSELILNIYESIFLAMSMGAAKIMGVAPARGLTKKFLPFEKCRRLLENVDLKSNATIDFTQIKKNAEAIPLPEREEIFIQDFNRMIEVITENYGRVMGYEAFRAMVRPEFMEIKKSYGKAMDQLNIKKSMHPEIAHLFT